MYSIQTILKRMSASTVSTVSVEKLSKWRKFAQIVYNLPEPPDTNFCPLEPSSIISLKDLPAELQLGNGGDWCRDSSKHNFRFNRIKDKASGKGITHIQILPLSVDEMMFETNRPIGDHIYEYFKNKPCVVCGSYSDTVVDHKNDLYNDPRVLNIRTQTPDDFQTLCNRCNLRKRQTAKEMRETGKRYPASNIPMLVPLDIDFSSGDLTYDPTNPNATNGTFWYDPVAFIEACMKSKNDEIERLKSLNNVLIEKLKEYNVIIAQI